MKRALISVSDKAGLADLVRDLSAMNFEIYSTGGTAKVIREAGVSVKDISQLTGFPEMMDGRVKTLHPKVHGGLLMRQGIDDAVAKEHGIEPIDLVVVNLYPFEETVAKEGVTDGEAIEQIDIGGPSMLRSAAKNFARVTVVCEPNDYGAVILELQKNGETSLETRRKLAQKVFFMTSRYDLAISRFLHYGPGAPEPLDLHYEKIMSLRYGENPHQKAAFFRDPKDHAANVTNAKIVQGKQLSYNNIIDTDAALELVKDFEVPAAAIIKHMNPCGVATANSIEEAFQLAYEVDPLSAFGGVIALNRECSASMVGLILKQKWFVEIIIAPSFEKKALELLEKRAQVRVLESGPLVKNPDQRSIRSVGGGLLVQTADDSVITAADWQVVTEAAPTEAEAEALVFARTVAKHVKSNAVVFAKKHEEGGCMASGIGAGQMSRVDSVMIASRKGGARVPGSVMASDAFFPFPDAVEEAHSAGIHAIIQPGGSIRDAEVIAKANELGMTMVFTGVRSFKH